MSIEMNANIAKTLIKNYTDNHLAVINSSEELTDLRQENSTSDARCVWFSINELKTFITKIESTTAEKCYAVTGALGIRIYYCEYPAADSPLWGTAGLPNTLSQYAGMHTVMLVPTYNNGTKDVDFDPDYATNAGIPIPITEVFNSTGPSPLPATNVMMMNHGTCVPPPYPTTGIYGPTTGAYMLDISNTALTVPSSI